MNWPAWFKEIWPHDRGRNAVLQDYQALGAMPHLLTDIALRNYVFAAAPPAATLYDAGVAEGRRRAALEIFTLANMPPEQLWQIVPKKPSGERTP